MAKKKPDKMRRLGRAIALAREAAYLTQDELARAAGIPVATLQRVEQGDSQRPRLDTAGFLADALQLNLADLWAELRADLADAAKR